MLIDGESTPAKLRFGVMCDTQTLQAWQADALDHLLSSGCAELRLVIQPASGKPTQRRRPLLSSLLDHEFRRNLLWLLYMRLLGQYAQAIRSVDCSARLGAVERLNCRVIYRGRYSQHFSDADVRKIKAYDLDFIVKFGFGIVRGAILESARYGIWSYHHDDERLIRGGPPGFWEIYLGHPTSGAILQRLTNTLDGGIVLHRGVFSTHWEYLANRDQLYFGSSDWCARAAKDLMTGNLTFVNGRPSETRARIVRLPNNSQFLRFAFQQLVGHVRSRYRSYFYRDIWNVGFVEHSAEDMLRQARLRDVAWLPSPRSYRFIADPFPLSGLSGTSLLVEDFEYVKSCKGIISRVCIHSDSGQARICPVINARWHLSYPCVFQANGKVYCIPESYEAGGCDLYGLDDRNEFVLVRRLLHDIAVVDPTVFWYAGRWWLFCTILGSGDNNKLYAYHATEPESEWRPHALNPLKCDVTSARPAGVPFVADGALYRPAQNCSVTYGGAVTLNHVVELSPERFEEVTVHQIEPEQPGPYPDGFHTLNALGKRCVVDGKARVFDPTWIFRRRAFHRANLARIAALGDQIRR
jgi:hypothetical protein